EAEAAGDTGAGLLSNAHDAHERHGAVSAASLFYVPNRVSVSMGSGRATGPSVASASLRSHVVDMVLLFLATPNPPYVRWPHPYAGAGGETRVAGAAIAFKRMAFRGRKRVRTVRTPRSLSPLAGEKGFARFGVCQTALANPREGAARPAGVHPSLAGPNVS